MIDSLDKAQKLPDRGDFPGEFGLRLCYPILPDFEALVENFDVIDFQISKDKRLYRALYGCDCDSILIVNNPTQTPLAGWGLRENDIKHYI